MMISASTAAASSPAHAPAIAGPSRSRPFHPTAQPSPPLESPNWKLREGESIFKTAVFLGSMIVVAVLLLVLICMARWDNIVSLVPLFNSDAASVAAAGGRRWRWSRRRPATSDAHRRQGSTRQRQQLQFDVESLPDEQQPVLSSSLSKKNRSHNKRMVEALPVISYASAAAASSSLELGSLLLGLECTICLCEFADGDRVRFLPDCCHGFHVECVDVWLIAHASCPSCRNSLHTGVSGSLQTQQPSTSSGSFMLSSSSSTISNT